MTYLESIYKDKTVVVIGIKSNRGVLHLGIRKYVGRAGTVVGESKNNQLLVRFQLPLERSHLRAIPPGCVSKLDEVRFSKDYHANGVK